jgi:hypothetical protein
VTEEGGLGHLRDGRHPSPVLQLWSLCLGYYIS